MENYLKKLVLFGVPLTILAFCLITAKADQACDGDSFTAYGFPLLWTTPGATSLSTVADLMVGTIDLAVYLAIFAAICATRVFDGLIRGKAVILSVVLWLGAICIGGGFWIVLSFD